MDSNQNQQLFYLTMEFPNNTQTKKAKNNKFLFFLRKTKC
jgi:hypothetical protein